MAASLGKATDRGPDSGAAGDVSAGFSVYCEPRPVASRIPLCWPQAQQRTVVYGQVLSIDAVSTLNKSAIECFCFQMLQLDILVQAAE